MIAGSNTPSYPPAAATADADDRVVVGRYRSGRDAFDHSLVVAAMGEDCWLEHDPVDPDHAGEHLLVRPDAAPHVREQLARFDQESLNWPPRPPAEIAIVPHRGRFPPLLWALVLVAVFRAQQTSPALVAFGALDARAVWSAGEGWRPFTALFLHADAGHLLSNLVSGWFVLRTWFGLTPLGRGWLALLGSATFANLVVAAIGFAGEHRSLGASTLVFAGLGLLTGSALRRRSQPGRWRPLLVPAAAGLTLLGLYGAGDAQTDVLAHVAGFVCGTLAGFLTSRTDPFQPSRGRGRHG